MRQRTPKMLRGVCNPTLSMGTRSCAYATFQQCLADRNFLNGFRVQARHISGLHIDVTARCRAAESKSAELVRAKEPRCIAVRSGRYPATDGCGSVSASTPKPYLLLFPGCAELQKAALRSGSPACHNSLWANVGPDPCRGYIGGWGLEIGAARSLWGRVDPSYIGRDLKNI